MQAFKCRYNLQETSDSLLREAADVNKSLYDDGILCWFSFYKRMCKLINTTIDDPSGAANLLAFLCNKFVYNSQILYQA